MDERTRDMTNALYLLITGSLPVPEYPGVMMADLIETHDACVRAEAKAEALRAAAPDYDHYWQIVLHWAKDDGQAIKRLSVLQMRTLCERLESITRHAILADQPNKKPLGTVTNPFVGTYNAVCFQRHDSGLRVGIAERDDGFELVVHGTNREIGFYALHPNATMERLDEPKEREAEGVESEESRDERLALKRQLGAGCHDECGDLPEEDQ